MIQQIQHKKPLQATPSDNTTPYQYFKMLITDELLADVSEQTNLYSVHFIGVSNNSTLKDLEKFIGV